MKTIAAFVAAALLLAGCAAQRSAPPADAPPPASFAQTLTVDAQPGRTVDLVISRPSRVRGVAVFGHGLGSRPSAYVRLTRALTDAGWLVIAPLHVDSLAHPRRAEFSRQQSFAARIADLAAATRTAATLAPGKPIVAVGQSYGSLFAAMEGGALADMVPPSGPPVRAVLAFSSPGRLPGLITARSYATLSVPTMTVTGEADLVPGFVADWHDHLAAFEDSPAGDKYAVIVKTGEHRLVEVDAPGRDIAMRAAIDFLAAYGLGDTSARARLAALHSEGSVEIRRR